MVECAKCNKKLGFLQTKHNHTDKRGNFVKYCSNCHEEYEIKQNEKRLSEIKLILKRYFDKCDIIKKVAIGRIYSEKEIFEKLEDDNLDKINQYFIDTHSNVEQAINGGDYDDLDDYLHLKQICEVSSNFLNDFEKLFRLFIKKKIDTDYIELIKLFYNLVEETIHKENEQILKPEYKRISNKLKNISVRSVLKEFMNSPLNPDIDTKLPKLLLNKFKLKFDEDELLDLIKELKEEIDLENFEKNLGEKNKKVQLPEYDHLTGHQFESFLKKVFEALDYVVVNTKLSGDQGADLIIMKDGEKTVVQAKKYSGKVSNKAIQEVVAAKKHYKCKNTMVVTTGEYTKSAIQLAISNKVEIWDKTKLDKEIAKINNASNTNTKSFQSTTLNKDSFPVFCSYCNSPFNISIDDLPVINEQTEMECPECNMTLSIQLPEQEGYTCIGCKKRYKTVREKIEHSKKCKKVKERQFKCKSCMSEFTLDDSELSEFKKKGNLTTECPTCKKTNILTS
jgi:hypothetical protein